MTVLSILGAMLTGAGFAAQASMISAMGQLRGSFEATWRAGDQALGDVLAEQDDTGPEPLDALTGQHGDDSRYAPWLLHRRGSGDLLDPQLHWLGVSGSGGGRKESSDRDRTEPDLPANGRLPVVDVHRLGPQRDAGLSRGHTPVRVR